MRAVLGPYQALGDDVTACVAGGVGEGCVADGDGGEAHQPHDHDHALLGARLHGGGHREGQVDALLCGGWGYGIGLGLGLGLG